MRQNLDLGKRRKRLNGYELYSWIPQFTAFKYSYGGLYPCTKEFGIEIFISSPTIGIIELYFAHPISSDGATPTKTEDFGVDFALGAIQADIPGLTKTFCFAMGTATPPIISPFSSSADWLLFILNPRYPSIPSNCQSLELGMGKFELMWTKSFRKTNNRISHLLCLRITDYLFLGWLRQLFDHFNFNALS